MVAVRNVWQRCIVIRRKTFFSYFYYGNSLEVMFSSDFESTLLKLPVIYFRELLNVPLISIAPKFCNFNNSFLPFPVAKKFAKNTGYVLSTYSFNSNKQIKKMKMVHY